MKVKLASQKNKGKVRLPYVLAFFTHCDKHCRASGITHRYAAMMMSALQ